MRMVLFICTLVAAMGFATMVCADIYVWTDADGIKHFTNQTPPEQAVLFMTTPEIDSVASEVDRVKRADPGEVEDLQAEQLRLAQEKIDDLTEQVQGLRQELQAALEPVPDQPDPETAATDGTAVSVGYRYGHHALYDPYGYLWHREIIHHRRPGHGHAEHKKAVPIKHRIKNHGPVKRNEGSVAGAERHSPGYKRSVGMSPRTGRGATHPGSGFRSGWRGGHPARR